MKTRKDVQEYIVWSIMEDIEKSARKAGYSLQEYVSEWLTAQDVGYVVECILHRRFDRLVDADFLALARDHEPTLFVNSEITVHGDSPIVRHTSIMKLASASDFMACLNEAGC